MNAVAARLRRRLRGAYEVDPWGADPELVELVSPLTGLVLRVATEGAEHVPQTGPAVLVCNRRFGIAEPFVVQRAIRLHAGRRVRFLGIPDVPVVGPALRRLGGGVKRPEELAAMLRAGHLVALPMERSVHRLPRAEGMAPNALAAAFQLSVPVVPVAVVGGELTGSWRVYVGEPVIHPGGTSPLALAELAEAAESAVQELLDEAFPPRWLIG